MWMKSNLKVFSISKRLIRSFLHVSVHPAINLVSLPNTLSPLLFLALNLSISLSINHKQLSTSFSYRSISTNSITSTLITHHLFPDEQHTTHQSTNNIIKTNQQSTSPTLPNQVSTGLSGMSSGGC